MTKIYILEKDGIPFYVGKSINPIRRKHKHYQKYGNDIHLIIIDEVENWKYWESFWIEQFTQWGFILLNQNKGGGGPERYSDESKQKMRKPRPGSGVKISKTLIERNHSKYYTPKVREKMSLLQIGISKPFTEEHIFNMGVAKRKDAKTVLQYDLEGNLIKEWESKGQAANWIKETLNKKSNVASQIKDCILGRQKTAFNYKWKYKI